MIVNSVTLQHMKQVIDTCRETLQSEREYLGIVFGIEHFRLFLLGHQFELETDHKTNKK